MPLFFTPGTMKGVAARIMFTALLPTILIFNCLAPLSLYYRYRSNPPLPDVSSEETIVWFVFSLSSFVVSVYSFLVLICKSSEGTPRPISFFQRLGAHGYPYTERLLHISIVAAGRLFVLDDQILFVWAMVLFFIIVLFLFGLFAKNEDVEPFLTTMCIQFGAAIVQLILTSRFGIAGLVAVPWLVSLTQSVGKTDVLVFELWSPVRVYLFQPGN